MNEKDEYIIYLESRVLQLQEENNIIINGLYDVVLLIKNLGIQNDLLNNII